MKTEAEIKFDSIIKLAFQDTLKPLGFKKRSNNFYRVKGELGNVVNIQKSALYSREMIRFTINVGIFAPKHWYGSYYNDGKELPTFPPHYECILNKRIGKLKKENDSWSDVHEDIEIEFLIKEMQDNLNNHIIPFFNEIENYDDVLLQLETNRPRPDLDRLILLAELKYTGKAKQEYQDLLNEASNPHFRETVLKYGARFSLDLK